MRTVCVRYAICVMCVMCALCVCVYAYIIREQFSEVEPPPDQWVVKYFFGGSYRHLALSELVSRPELAVTVL